MNQEKGNPAIPQPFARSTRVMRSPIKQNKSTDTTDGYDCRSCDKPNSVENMVQCDKCPAWYHYTCVNVDSYICDQNWVCPTCEGKNVSLSSSLREVSAAAAKSVSGKDKGSALSLGTIPKSSAISLASNNFNSANTSSYHSKHPLAEPNQLLSTTTTLLAFESDLNHAASSSTHLIPSIDISPAQSTAASTKPVSSSSFALSTSICHGAESISYQRHALNNSEHPISIAGILDTTFSSLNLGQPLTTPSTRTSTIGDQTRTSYMDTEIGAINSAPISSSRIQSFLPKSSLPTYHMATVDSSAGVLNNASKTFNPLETNDPPITAAKKRTSKHSCSSKSSKATFYKQIQLNLQKLEEEMAMQERREKEYLNRKEKRDSEYLSKKYEMLTQLEESESDLDSVDDDQEGGNTSTLNVSSWLKEVPWKRMQSTTVLTRGDRSTTSKGLPSLPGNKGKVRCTPPTEQLNHHVQGKRNPPAIATSQHQIFSSDMCSLANNNPSAFNTQRPVVTMHSNNNNNRPSVEHTNANEIHVPVEPVQKSFQDIITKNQLPDTKSNEFNSRTLNRNQLDARQLMSKDLHPFGGNPEDWPLFIADFNRSTELCAFNDEENLTRLNRSLKGEALNSVRSMLIQPNCVPDIISTLKMLYGRPEIIIHSLLRKIRSTPPPKAEKLDTIVTFALAVQNLCAVIEASGLTDHLNNPTLLQELVDKLPPTIRLNWAIYKQTTPNAGCSLLLFKNWVYQIAEAASGVLLPLPAVGDSKQTSRISKEKGYINAHCEIKNETDNITPTLASKCCICGGQCVSVDKCMQFQKLNRSKRWYEVRKHQLCRRCLIKHSNNRCYSTAVCGVDDCVFKHNKLLHKDLKDIYRCHLCNKNKVSLSSSKNRDEQDIGTIGLHSKGDEFTSLANANSILFRIVPVVLYGKGTQIHTLAFLDEGSSITLMDEEIARQLRVEGTPQTLCLKWTGNTSRIEKDSKVLNLEISSTATKAKKFTLRDVHTVENLHLPSQSLDPIELQKKYAYLKGIPFEAYRNDTPRLLIGLNNSSLGFPLRSKEGGVEEPVATKTRLGWVLHGVNATEFKNPVNAYYSLHICNCNDSFLDKLVKNYLCLDSFGTSPNSSSKLLSVEDERALELLKTRTVYKNGRFETPLLWKFDQINLPNSLPMAKKRLQCLQRRMKRESGLAEALNSKIGEYVLKGYARKLLPSEIQPSHHHQSWYLPIFPVKNPNKPGKLRIVWDAAATVQGISLNSVLLKGPDQLTSLTSVIMKFRENKIAICGDIQEMFHQVRIKKEDQDFQRFLWSKNENDTPEVYVMTVMTFGATCSPCSAQFVKNSNAERFTEKFPRAVQSIKENHYVDDLMDSLPTETEAIKLAREVRYIHEQGGFHIRNWISNSPLVLQELHCQPTTTKNLNAEIELGTEKVLGMWWCTSSDCLIYKITTDPRYTSILLGSRRPTKREVLRTLMTIFDPLGLLANFLMYIKILLQDIWRSKIEWDTEICDAEYKKWLKWIRYLPEIEAMKIPRCYISRTSWGRSTQLHIFVDASENGFAAVAYVRTTGNKTVECALIGAKTRVAPLKSLSIPRLELQAALLGARFAKSVADSHSVQFAERIFWSDSKNVLCWLRSDHRRYRQFVAFRVSEILDSTEISEWRWIPTKQNVADEATKWQKVPDFKSSSRWFSGPGFLMGSEESWPQETTKDNTTIEELKPHFINIHSHNFSCESVLHFNDISSYNLLLRSTAYVLIWRSRLLKRKLKIPYEPGGPLTQEELQQAENVLFKTAQSSEYQEEISDLEISKRVQKSSPLYNLCPFLDENKILRADDRTILVREAGINVRHRIILPRAHPITSLIITDHHHRYKHKNHETVINELRQKFFITQMRAAFRAIRKKCQECKNALARPQPPKMAPLPSARLSAFCSPFSYVGIDYFGPLNVTVGRRIEKRWGVLLTCLTIRAVHVEVAHSLTTDSCILAIRNFMARRGTPLEFHSDNGTNFKGAERDLKEALMNVKGEKLAQTFTSTTTKWTFIPPGSPHMGGSWERMVRSIKTVLYEIMPKRTPSDELLKSMLIEAEHIVNSRPLSYIPVENENQEALTPNHFLLGSSNGSKPFTVFNDDKRVLRLNWHTSQQFADHFWRRWVKEYLPSLTGRAKWFTPVRPVRVGDIVVIVDPNSPRNVWPKGKVIKTKVSKDGQVRSASVQTQTGVYDRPVVKLAVLDVGYPPEAELPGVATVGECYERACSPNVNEQALKENRSLTLLA